MTFTTILLLLLGFVILGAGTVVVILLLDGNSISTRTPSTSSARTPRSISLPRVDSSKILRFLKKHWKIFTIVGVLILGLIFHDVMKEILEAIGVLSIAAFAIMWLTKSVTKKSCSYQGFALAIGIICLVLSCLCKVLPW